LFTERLVKTNNQYFIRGGIIQTLVRLHDIVEISEVEKLNMATGVVFKGSLTVPMSIVCG
jgi:hypothetical protein